MVAPAQTRNLPAPTAQPEPQAGVSLPAAQAVEAAFAAGAEQALGELKLTPAPGVEAPSLPGASGADAATMQLAQETVRSLDDGSFRGIASADRIASLELARRTIADQRSRVQQIQDLNVPTKVSEGYSPTELLQRMLSDIALSSRAQLLSARRAVTVRSARDSLQWLLKGVAGVAAAGATLLGTAPQQQQEKGDIGDVASGALDDQPSQEEGTSYSNRKKLATRAMPQTAPEQRERKGLRLMPEDEAAES